MKYHNIAFQGIKFLLVGAFATVIDLIFFELFIMVIAPIPLIAKSISFLISTAIKYGGNKFWTFNKFEREHIYREVFIFFGITALALVIDLCVFYYATKIAGPQFGLSTALWTPVSVVLAALSSAFVSFAGYKFLVFKK